LPLADFLSRRVRLVKSGMHTKAVCPFHQEKSPSFVLYNDHYHCFGCGAHGDIITFTMQMDRLSFPDAVEKLAGEAGMPVPTLSPQDRANAATEARGYDALAAA
jgi:DNA primase